MTSACGFCGETVELITMHICINTYIHISMHIYTHTHTHTHTHTPPTGSASLIESLMISHLCHIFPHTYVFVQTRHIFLVFYLKRIPTPTPRLKSKVFYRMFFLCYFAGSTLVAELMIICISTSYK